MKAKYSIIENIKCHAGDGTEKKMAVLNNLKPEKVFGFFEEISQIPRGSGNTEQIAQYCLDFAVKRNLKAVKDEGGNVIIYAPGTAGYENSEPVIIQGHMDMVCEKTLDCTKDMDKEGIDLCTDGEYVWADGTTLGGDDGIAIAFMFAILDSDDIPHPPIEAVITRDEETGMYGAIEFDSNSVKGTKMLNIDSEEEGILTVSCAGGISAHCVFELPKQYKSVSHMYEISVSGLLGGHSGADIGKERLNAFRILAEPLASLGEDYLFGSISGGGKMNVIPQNASIVIGTDNNAFEELKGIIEVCNAKKLGGDTDPGAAFAVRELSDAEFTGEFFESPALLGKIREFLGNAPTGVCKWSEDIEGLVESSLNLGVMELKDNILSADFLVRSNSDGGRAEVVDTLRSFAESMKDDITFAEFELSAEYPAWEYRKDSPLRDTMAEVFREVYGKEPVISAIHAGLECAIFSSKLRDADMVSIGPNIHDIHTPEERMEVASVARTWEYVKALLKAMK